MRTMEDDGGRWVDSAVTPNRSARHCRKNGAGYSGHEEEKGEKRETQWAKMGERVEKRF